MSLFVELIWSNLDAWFVLLVHYGSLVGWDGLFWQCTKPGLIASLPLGECMCSKGAFTIVNLLLLPTKF